MRRLLLLKLCITVLLVCRKSCNVSGLEKLIGLKCLDLNSNLIDNKNEYLTLWHLNALSTLRFSQNPVSTIKFSNTYLVSSLARDIQREKVNIKLHLKLFYFNDCD